MTEPTHRIEAALSQLGREHEPPAGWEARVLAATSAPRRKPWWLFATSALALAGAAALAVPQLLPAAQIAALTADAPWTGGGTVTRGKSPEVGDLLHAAARGGGGYRAVWVYRGDALVAACPGGPRCRFDGDEPVADVELASITTYRVVALSSTVPLPPPQGTYETDVVNARTAGAVVIVKELPVR